MKLIVLVILFSIFQVFNLKASDGNISLKRYVVDNWSISENIKSTGIRSMAQTPDGFLWLATEKQLIRYDGIDFVEIPYAPDDNSSELRSVTPDTLYVDRNGALWIGSAAGLTRYWFRNRSFFTHSLKFQNSDGRFRFINEDGLGNIWASSFSSHLCRFSKGEFEYFNEKDGLVDNKVNALVEWKKDHILFGTLEKGAFVFTGDSFSPKSIPCLGTRQIVKMHIDRLGDLWIGTNDGLYRIVDSNVNTCSRYSVENGLSGDHISAFAEDDDGNLWIGTYPGGITRIRHMADESLDLDSFLPSLSVVCLLIDRENNLWVGTQGDGLFRLKNRRLSSFRPLNSYPHESISSAFQSSTGVTWLGMISGKLFRLEGENVYPVEIPELLRGLNLVALTEDGDGNLWIGTNGKGAFCRQNGEWHQLLSKHGLADNLVTTIFKDRSGDIWFGTFNGISVRRSLNEKIEAFRSNDGLIGKIVHAIYEDKKQNILVATGKGLTLIKDGLFLTENIRYLLNGESITCMKQDDLSLSAGDEVVYWIATYGSGLKKLNMTDGAINISTFDKQAGMPTNYFSGFFEDKYGFFWLLSDVGVLRVSKVDLNGYSNRKREPVHCWIYGQSEGVNTFDYIEFARHLAIETKDGEFWFANKREILRINPSEVKINSIAPIVVLEEVLREGNNILSLGEQQEHIFKGKADWNFRFTSPCLSTPDRVRFKYRLSGLSDEWDYLPFKAERMVEYKNLGAGKYRFEVFACNADGIWSAEPAVYPFVVEAFFAETATFKGLLVVSFMGLIGLSIYLYLLWKNKPEAKRLPAYHGTQPLHPDFARECLRKLDHQMKVEKIYTDPDLTLKKLADSINVNTHTLSRLLNDNLDVRFSEFVNTNRIDEAKRILEDPQHAHVKIISVGLDVGFNTMPAFYNAFKKNTGMTPNTYKKTMKKKKK